jgi:phosphatidylglycerophosphate synthase
VTARGKPVGELLFARLYLRRLSAPITAALLRTSVTPNQVTAAFVALGLVGGLLQIEQEVRAISIAGALVLQLCLVVDCVDGDIARARRLYSVRGPYLDMVGHRLIHAVLFFSIGLGLYRRSGEACWLVEAAGASFGELAFTLVLYAKWRALLDYPDLLRRELERIERAPAEDRKALKAALGRRAAIHPLVWPYHIVFGIDYPGVLLAAVLVGAAVDGLGWILIFYGTVLPVRAFVQLVRMMRGDSIPELDRPPEGRP